MPELEREKSREEQVELLLEAKTIENFDVLWAEMGHEDIKDLLYGRIVGEWELGEGANRPKILELGNGKEAIYKPQKRAKDVFPGLPIEQKHIKEWLAKRLEELLEFDVIPQTVIRENGEGIGSVQKFVPGYPIIGEFRMGRFRQSSVDRSSITKIAILDFLLQNLDRTTSNLFRPYVDPGADPKILGIDHGDSLPEKPFFYIDIEDMLQRRRFSEKEVKSKIWALYLAKGKVIAPDISRSMEKLRDGSGQKILKKIFELAFGEEKGKEKCDLTLHRLSYLLERKKVPDYLYSEVYARATRGSTERQKIKDHLFETCSAVGTAREDLELIWSEAEKELDGYYLQEMIQKNLDEDEEEQGVIELKPEDLKDVA